QLLTRSQPADRDGRFGENQYGHADATPFAAGHKPDPHRGGATPDAHRQRAVRSAEARSEPSHLLSTELSGLNESHHGRNDAEHAVHFVFRSQPSVRGTGHGWTEHL